VTLRGGTCRNGHDHGDNAAARNACERGNRLEGDHSAAEKVALADANHIWLNAFCCIRPSDEFLLSVGRTVVAKLMESKMADDFVGLSRVTYIRINCS
jgi:hypothetical protein